MKSFAYIVNKKVPSYNHLDVILALWKWLDDNAPGRWDNRGNVINFEHDEDATMFLLVYTGNEDLKVHEI